MIKFFLFYLIFLSFTTVGQDASFGKPDITEEDVEVYDSNKYYVIFNHATREWDYSLASKDGALKLFRIINKKPEKFESFVFAEANAFHGNVSYGEEYDSQAYYIKGLEADHALLSSAGAHKLSFPNSQILIIAGGNLTLCLCQTIRDSIRGSNNSLPLNLVLVTDAIYDVIDTAVPYFKTPPRTTGTSANLEKLLSLMVDDNKIHSFLKREVIGEESFCPVIGGTTQGENSLNPKNYKFVFKREGKELGIISNGNKIINIHLTKVSNFEKTIYDIESSGHTINKFNE